LPVLHRSRSQDELAGEFAKRDRKSVGRLGGRGIEVEDRAVGTGSNGHEHEFSYLEGVACADHGMPYLSLGIFGIVGHHEEVLPLKDEQVCRILGEIETKNDVGPFEVRRTEE